MLIIFIFNADVLVRLPDGFMWIFLIYKEGPYIYITMNFVIVTLLYCVEGLPSKRGNIFYVH